MEKNKLNLAIVNGKPYDYEKAIENQRTGYSYVTWGENNTFPQYLYELFETCPIHQSIIEGIATYVLGDGMMANAEEIVNEDEETLQDILEKLIMDYLIFGGFCVQKISKRNGQTSIYYVDMRFIRVNEDETKAYYHTDWTKYRKVIDASATYDIIKPSQTNGLIYYKGKSRTIYPTPRYVAALKSLEIEREIDTFHLYSIKNNFTGNLLFNIINENSNNLSDEDKKAVEKQIIEKYCGAENSSKFLLSFVQDKDSVMKVDRIDSDKSDERFQTLEKTTKQNIFISHRVTSPQLFGMLNEGSGFSLTEYEESFKIFNNTVIVNFQNELERQFSKIFESEVKFNRFVYEDKTKENDKSTDPSE